jgi:predicted dehydrogenase
LFHRDGRRETVGDGEATGGGADPMAFTHDAHRALINAFVDALYGGPAPANDGDAALRVHDLIDALLASSRQRRAVAVRQRQIGSGRI